MKIFSILTSNTSRPAKCMVVWEVAAMPGWKSWALAVKMPKIETRKKAKEIPMILIINLAGKNCRETYKTSKHEIRFQNTSLPRHSLWKLFENNVSVYKQRLKIWSILDRLTDFWKMRTHMFLNIFDTFFSGLSLKMRLVQPIFKHPGFLVFQWNDTFHFQAKLTGGRESVPFFLSPLLLPLKTKVLQWERWRATNVVVTHNLSLV